MMRNVVEGVSMISEVPDRWLRPGKRKFTVDLNGGIANHGKAIWRYVLKRSAEIKGEFKRILIPVTCLNDYLVSAEAFPPRSEYRS